LAAPGVVNADTSCYIQQAMSGSQFQQRLDQELRNRRLRNPRYSLRAFAALLHADHSTLSQILRNRRPIPIPQLRQWAKKLGLTSEEISAFVAAEHLPDPATLKRQQQLRHWTAEALAVMNDRSHWEIIRLARTRGFPANSRALAIELGVSVDQVNVALGRLLRLGLLEMAPRGRWKLLLDLTRATEADFRMRSLIRIRELAAADGVQLGRFKTKATNQ
jgi:transcriptional regulator with XRE-family HTH domain